MFLHYDSHHAAFNESMITIDWGGKPQPHHLRLIANSLRVAKGNVEGNVTQQSVSEGLAGVDWRFAMAYWGVILAWFLTWTVYRYFVAKDGADMRPSDLSPRTREETSALPGSIYALPLACALRQVKLENGQYLPVWAAYIFGLSVAVVQIWIVVMFYDSIDVAAPPITPKDQDRHVSTNQMKIAMTIFLSMFSVEDSTQLLKILRLTLLVDPSNEEPARFDATPTEVKTLDPYVQISLLMFPIIQFLNLLIATSVGVEALMSEQAGLMVVSNAVSICFVTQVDDLTWKFAAAAFGLSANLKVPYKEGQEDFWVHHREKETWLRSAVWFPVVFMWYLFVYAFRVNRLPWLPNPLVDLGFRS